MTKRSVHSIVGGESAETIDAILAEDWNIEKTKRKLRQIALFAAVNVEEIVAVKVRMIDSSMQQRLFTDREFDLMAEHGAPDWIEHPSGPEEVIPVEELGETVIRFIKVLAHVSWHRALQKDPVDLVIFTRSVSGETLTELRVGTMQGESLAA